MPAALAPTALPVHWFRPARYLTTLNTVAVGASLAACTGVALWGCARALPLVLPTFVAGAGWFALLRSRKPWGTTRFLWGWVAAAPIAYLNCAAAVYLALLSEPGGILEAPPGFLVALLMAIPGVIVWFPALILTLVCLGPPIVASQRMARRGLESAERGEALVGAACTSLALIGSVVLHLRPTPTRFEVPGLTQDDAGRLVLAGFALLGAAAGVASVAISIMRGRVRRTVLAAAEAGRVPGYRVEPTGEGKRLLRLAVPREGYRVADVEEEVFHVHERRQDDGERAHVARE